MGIEEKRYRGIDSLMTAIRASLKSKPDILVWFEAIAPRTTSSRISWTT